MSDMADRIKLALSLAFIVGGLVAFYVYSAQPTWARAAMVIVGLAAGVVAAWTTGQGREFRSFTQDSIEEAKKVAWPDRKESFQTTAAVFAFVVAMALFLWVVDKLLEWGLYEKILGWGHQ
jgi:preprotein translocase subunit SecE